MKRAFYEWAGYSCAILAAVALGYTVVSLATDRADFTLIFDHAMQVCATSGKLTISDALGNGQLIDEWDLSTHQPAVSSDLNVTIRGFGFRHVAFVNVRRFTVWYFRLPTLVMFIVFTLVGMLCFVQARKISRASRRQATT